MSSWKKRLSLQKNEMMETEEAIVQSLSYNFSLSSLEQKEFAKHLADSINHLIQDDFPRLVQILYRLDISETKLKEMLATSVGQDSGLIISQLLIERERKKILTREQFRRDDDIPENEKW